jgi:hypothetical protein
MTADGRNYKDLHKFLLAEDMEGAKALMQEIEDSKTFNISYGKFHNPETGEMVMIGTSKEARAWMTKRSQEYEMTFTKG